MTTPAGAKPAARRRARRFLVQSLYQQALSGMTVTEIEVQFHQDNDMSRTDVDYYHDVLTGIERESGGLLEELASVIDRRIDELDPVELSILKLGAYELLFRIDVPYRVVINESVELAKIFGAEDGYKYVNSVLDKLSGRHRVAEVSHTGPRL